LCEPSGRGQTAPSEKLSATRLATCTAIRVFPDPPEPDRVTSGVVARSPPDCVDFPLTADEARQIAGQVVGWSAVRVLSIGSIVLRRSASWLTVFRERLHCRKSIQGHLNELRMPNL
jgi:hypothetical protein